MNDYIDFLHETYPEIQTETKDVVYNGSVIGSVKDDIIDFSLGVPLYSDVAKDLDGFTRMFVHKWWKKYQTRVKIVFNLPPKAVEMQNMAMPNAFTKEEEEEIIKSVRHKLMQYGEVCCTLPMAQNMLHVHVKNAQRKEWTIENKVNLRTTLIRHAKEVAYSHGVVLFIKPDLKKAHLNEFRDDNAAKVM
jgi:hypothetical protein